jgi:hypothetical protein
VSSPSLMLRTTSESADFSTTRLSHRRRKRKHRLRLVNAEVLSDAVYAHEPKNEQRDGERADECEHSHDEAADSVGRELSPATWQPPGLCVSRERFGGHRT